MNYQEWQLKRRELSELVKKDRQENWTQGHPNVNIAIMEMALRVLFDEVARLSAIVGKGK